MSIFAEPEIVTRKGKPVSVILPIKDYEELIERTEDADDIAWLKQARRKPLRYRPLADYLAGSVVARTALLGNCQFTKAGG
jgi:Antitoxin Phd_YefM, type II toxin-antitoxin system